MNKKLRTVTLKQQRLNRSQSFLMKSLKNWQRRTRTKDRSGFRTKAGDAFRSNRVPRMAQIRLHNFTFQWYRKEVFLTTKKQSKQVAVSKKNKSADKYYEIAKPEKFSFTIIILIIDNNNSTLFKVKKLRVMSKQNCCYNAELPSFVAPPGEQELT